MKWHSLRRLLSVLLAALLLMSSLATAGAAPTVPSDDEALQILVTYGIVKGDDHGNLNLDKEITRAEASTIFVRAMGQEQTAMLMKDLVTFDDAKGHWGAGFIAVAYRLGLMKGRSDTQFDPDAKITNQEVYTVILRMVKREPLGTWNPMLVMQTSRDLGLTPSNIDLGLLGPANALRRTIFNGLGKAVSSVALPYGKTILGTYIDTQAPTLTLDSLPVSTGSSSIRLTGTATGAQFLDVNGQQYRLTSPNFSIDVPLQNGTNTLEIAALDWAGNQATKSVRITRASEAATIVVAGDLSVKAGQTAPLQATAYDATGTALSPTDVSATVSNNMGRYDAATGKFTAGSTAGTGTITFKAGNVTETVNITVLGVASTAKSLRIKDGNGALSGSINKNTTVQVEVLDADGNSIAYDDGRSISLVVTGLSGARVLNATAVTIKGVATFTVTSTVMGEASLTAAANGLANGVGSVVYATSTRIKLVATPASATADGTTPISVRATLVDENGKEVINPSADLFISLSTDSNNSGFNNPLVIIRRNNFSSAGNDASLVPGFKTETVKVTGTVTSGQNYTVLPVSIPLKEAVVGNVSKFDVVGGGGVYTPGGSGANLTVRATDSNGNVVPQGTYAFQFEATTSNNEPLDPDTGLPDGLDIQLVSGITPSGRPLKGTTFVARTENGFATLKVTYNKSGMVTVKLVASPATAPAYNSAGEGAAASSSTSFTLGQTTVMFASPVKKLDPVVLTPSAGTAESQIGVLPNNGTSTLKVRVYLADLADGRIPNGAGLITLSKSVYNGATTAAVTSATATNGYAEFTLRATTTVGTDEWRVTYGGIGDVTNDAKPHAVFTIQTADTSLARPTVLSVYGGESGAFNRLAVSDTYLLVTLGEAEGGSETYGYVNFYRSGSTTPLWRSGVIDLGSLPAIQVPRSAFPTNIGTDRYQVEFVNGKGALPSGTGKSDLWPTDGSKVIIEQTVKSNISKVLYDAATDTLFVTASSLTTSGMIDGSALTIRSSQTSAEQDLGGAVCTVTSSSAFKCTNVGLVDVDGYYTGNFFGDVTLTTHDGWYRNDATGQSAPAETDTQLADNLINPLASIGTDSFVTFEYDTLGNVTSGKLTLIGSKLNLTSSTIDLTKLSFKVPAGPTVTLAAPTTVNGIKIDSRTDTAVIISLGNLADDIAALAGPTITVDKGWYYLGSNSSKYFSPGLTGRNVYAAAKITSIKLIPAGANPATNPAQLVITGSGFLDGDFMASLMKFKRGSSTATALPITGAADINANGTQVTFDLGDVTALNAAITAGPTYFVGDYGWSNNATGWDFSPVVYGKIRITK
jgi:hypothetical protein